MKEYFDIGIVAGVQGIQGEIKVYPYSHDPANLTKQPFFLIGDKKMAVRSARLQGKFIIIDFEKITSRNEAERLKGAVLQIPRSSATPLANRQYYMEDIIGCSVYEKDIFLGVVCDIIETGSNDVYAIETENNHEILIPAIKSVIISIDTIEKKIEVILPEGLVDNEYF